MKYIQDSSIFSVEKGKCWKNTSCFTGYGFGYPRKILWYNFEQLREEFPPLYVEHMSYATLTRKYYQRRTKQARLLSIMYVEKGGMYFNCDGQAMLAEAGDCVLLKPHCQNDFLYQPGNGFCSRSGYQLKIIIPPKIRTICWRNFLCLDKSCMSDFMSGWRAPEAKPFNSFNAGGRLRQSTTHATNNYPTACTILGRFCWRIFLFFLFFIPLFVTISAGVTVSEFARC